MNFKLDLEKAEVPEINCQHPLDHRKRKRVPEKHLFLLHTYTQTLRLKNSLPLFFQNLNFPVICILSLNNFSFSIYHLCFDSGIFIYFCSFSATKSCWTLCDPMNCNTLGSSILQYLPEFAQIHIL